MASASPPQVWPSIASWEPELLPQKEGEGTKEIPAPTHPTPPFDPHPHLPTHWIYKYRDPQGSSMKHTHTLAVTLTHRQSYNL